MHKAVFLDRDGTLMTDVGYCARPEDVSILPGVKDGLASLKAAGLCLVIVTNQSGIGRGYFSEPAFWAVQRALEDQLGPGLIDAIYFCPDHPDRPTARRKPGPGMLLEAARDLKIRLWDSYMVGDRPVDVEAGLAAGVRCCGYLGLLPSGNWPSARVFSAPCFSVATRTILGDLKKGQPAGGPDRDDSGGVAAFKGRLT
ncbi:MAG TPA: HAD family hydrolase [Chthoniobacterales bacterium]